MDAVQLLHRCYKAGKDKRDEDISRNNPFPNYEPLSFPWKVYDNFYRGHQWKDSLVGPMATWKSRPYTNFCFRGVEAYTTFLTDSRPSIEIGPVESGDETTADVVKAGVQRWWDVAGMDTKLHMAVKDSRKFGLGWLGLTVKDGDIRCRVINSQSVTVSPETTVENYDPSWLVYEYRTTVGKLKDVHPKAEWDDFSAEWSPYDPEASERIDERDQSDRESVDPATSVKVYEIWTKDSRTIEWDEEEGEQTVKKRAKLYPKGRRSIIAGGITLDDGDNPHDHGRFPFVPIFAYPTTGRFYPIGDIENILGLQVMYNRMMQLLFDTTVKAGGALYLTNPQLGLPMEAVTNDPVQVHEVQDVNAALKVERPPAPSRHVFDYLTMLEKQINDVLGLHDISHGAYTPGNKTAEEVNIIAQSDRTRVRAAARLLEWSLRELGWQLLRLMKQHHKDEWIVEVAGGYEHERGIEEGEDIEPDLERTTATFKGKDAITDKVLEYDLKIGTDSTLPHTQQQTVIEAQWEYMNGLIDEEEYFRRLGRPNYVQLAARAPARLQREKQHVASDGTVEADEQEPQAPQEPQALQEPQAPQGAQMPPELQSILSSLPPEAQAAVQQAMEQGMPPEQAAQMLMQSMADQGAPLGGTSAI